MQKNKETFCEFLTCFYNKGLAELICDCKDDKNFYFRRVNEEFGINDMFVFCEDEEYFVKAAALNPSVITAITPFDIRGTGISENYRISKRRQFCRSVVGNSGRYVRLIASHRPLIEKSASDTTKENFSMAIEFDEACFGLAEEELYCFLSVSEIEKAKIVEISWIHTEPYHRNKGYASTLLDGVASEYVKRGYLVTYHCDGGNSASANTALKCGFTETPAETVLERK